VVKERRSGRTFSHGQKRGPSRSAAAGGATGDVRRRPSPRGCAAEKGVSGGAAAPAAGGRAIGGGAEQVRELRRAPAVVRSSADNPSVLDQVGKPTLCRQAHHTERRSLLS
jgi:hypothetical protein